MARKTAEEAEKTRDRILDAAEAAFTAQGFEGAALSDIAAQAGVTKSLIHHHFESKQELWDTVRSRLLGLYAEEQAKVFASLDIRSGPQFIRRSFSSYFRFLQRHPTFLRMLLWTQAESGASFSHERDAASAALARQLVDQGTAQVRVLQDKGELRADLDARFINACFLALLRQWFVLRRDYFGGDDNSAALDDEYLHTAVTLFWEGVRPRGADTPAPT